MSLTWWRFLAFAVACLSAGRAWPADVPAQSVPARRAQHLARGVTLAAEPGGKKVDTPPFQQVTPRLAGRLAALGFDHVRLEVNPALLAGGEDLGEPREERLKDLDAGLDALAGAKLGAIVCPVLDAPGTVKLFRSRPRLRGYAAFLNGLARHLGGRDRDRTVLQVMGEGFVNDQEVWDLMMEMLTVQARRGGAGLTLIVPRNACSEGQWDAVMGLLAGTQVKDANVIYDLAFFEPVLFTHQGGPSRIEHTRTLTGLPYPSSMDLVRPVLLDIRDVPARAAAHEYAVEEWNAKKVRERIDRAADWAQRWKVTLRCGQFGARQAGPPPEARAAYVRDVRIALEDRKLGWTVRAWEGDFGIAAGLGAKQTVEPKIAEALGLGKGMNNDP